ncbi:hypothetical protein MUK42_33904 [Musa troglodytarum]|uniref:Uncharacterized protein n=1 Tax=Musa troglodytarum TaxID=320322 RepID=A0A9E7FFM5_9LILI|nr:hypothetical protein MUK42_33904 [Musa troglodytarum]
MELLEVIKIERGRFRTDGNSKRRIMASLGCEENNSSGNQMRRGGGVRSSFDFEIHAECQGERGLVVEEINAEESFAPQGGTGNNVIQVDLLRETYQEAGENEGNKIEK